MGCGHNRRMEAGGTLYVYVQEGVEGSKLHRKYIKRYNIYIYLRYMLGLQVAMSF